MRTWKVVILTICLISPLFAQIYKWTDSQGNVHFSDQPHPDAEKITIPEAQTFNPPPLLSPQASPTSSVKEGGDSERGYDVLQIIQPQNEETIRNTEGFIPVVVSIKPKLKGGDKLQILYDGKALGDPKPTTVFALNQVKRGSHTIAVQALDEEGNVLQTSESITVFMMQPRVNMVPRN